METFTKCHVCRADKNKARYIHLNFYQFPSGLTDLSPDQVWRRNFLRALNFSEEVIAQAPSQIEKKRIICSRHFVDSCFILRDGKSMLIHGAVPELFLDELQINEQQVVVTISDVEDNDVLPQPNHYLESIPEWTSNLDRQN